MLDADWLVGVLCFQMASLLLFSVIVTIINYLYLSCLTRLVARLHFYYLLEMGSNIKTMFDEGGRCQHNVFIEDHQQQPFI